MAFGLGVLRLSPEHFWSMTPREFAAAQYGATGRTGGSVRPDLAALMRLFPDETGGGDGRRF
jgi:uncharacterized phage protein (TIGR02216 family)